MLASVFGIFLGSTFGVVIVVLLVLSAIYFLIRRRLKQSMLFSLMGALRRELGSGQNPLGEEAPRSLSGLDQIYLPQIERSFRQLNIEEFRSHAEVLLLSVLEALKHQDVNLLYDAGPTYREQIGQAIRDMKDSSQSLSVEKAKVHKTVISAFKNAPSATEITFQSAVEARIALQDRDGKVLKGALDHVSQLRFEQTLIQIINPDAYQETEKILLTANCPNCGAVLSPQSDSCAYCGSHIDFIPIRVWVFSRLKRT